MAYTVRLLSILLAMSAMPVVSAQAQLMPTPLPIAPAAPAAPTTTTAAAAPTAAPDARAGQIAPVGLASLTNDYVPDATYKLRIGDTVSFQIVEDRLLKLQVAPASLVVMDSGEMDVPYIGRVMAVDKTCKQLGEQIERELQQNYYKKATVILSLNVANRLVGRVYIWGQVRSQGAVDLMVNEQMTVGKAIMRAGGFADFANKRRVKVVRGSSDPGGQTRYFNLDMTDILDKGDITKDLVLEPNDLIIVSSRLINF
jgi:protein involved in polysaccharide export with SLBB domain